MHLYAKRRWFVRCLVRVLLHLSSINVTYVSSLIFILGTKVNAFRRCENFANNLLFLRSSRGKYFSPSPGTMDSWWINKVYFAKFPIGGVFRVLHRFHKQSVNFVTECPRDVDFVLIVPVLFVVFIDYQLSNASTISLTSHCQLSV